MNIGLSTVQLESGTEWRVNATLHLTNSTVRGGEMATAKNTRYSNSLPIIHVGSGNVTQDLTGLRYGRLRVLHMAPSRGGGTLWECHCDCGATKVLKAINLRSGQSNSCGCLQRIASSVRSRRHGQSNTSEHNSWASAKSRCTNPNEAAYKNYGGRGIYMCSAWLNSFEQFFSDMGPRPHGLTLERKDVNGPYSSDNCIWASVDVQANNKRNSIRITHDGATRTLGQWAKSVGLNHQVLQRRLKAGMPMKLALSLPGQATLGHRMAAVMREMAGQATIDEMFGAAE